MADQRFVHGAYDRDSLLIVQPRVPQDQLIHVLCFVKAVSHGSCVLVTDPDVAAVNLIDGMLAMDEAKALRDVPVPIHFVQVVDQVRREVRLVVHLVHLNDFVSVFILRDCIFEGKLAHSEVVLFVVVFVGVLAFSRRTLIHFRLCHPVVVSGALHVDLNALSYLLCLLVQKDQPFYVLNEMRDAVILIVNQAILLL